MMPLIISFSEETSILEEMHKQAHFRCALMESSGKPVSSPPHCLVKKSGGHACVYGRSPGNTSFPAPSTTRDYNTKRCPEIAIKSVVEGLLEYKLGFPQEWTHCDLHSQMDLRRGLDTGMWPLVLTLSFASSDFRDYVSEKYRMQFPRWPP